VRLLKHPAVEAILLVLVWLLCLMYQKADPANVYARF